MQILSPILPPVQPGTQAQPQRPSTEAERQAPPAQPPTPPDDPQRTLLARRPAVVREATDIDDLPRQARQAINTYLQTDAMKPALNSTEGQLVGIDIMV